MVMDFVFLERIANSLERIADQLDNLRPEGACDSKFTPKKADRDIFAPSTHACKLGYNHKGDVHSTGGTMTWKTSEADKLPPIIENY